MFEITRKFLLGSLAALLINSAVQPADAQSFTPSRFTVDVRGDGPDVILIPGLGSSRDVWAAQVEARLGDASLGRVPSRGGRFPPLSG